MQAGAYRALACHHQLHASPAQAHTQAAGHVCMQHRASTCASCNDICRRALPAMDAPGRGGGGEGEGSEGGKGGRGGKGGGAEPPPRHQAPHGRGAPRRPR
eukprot:8193508-Alexandrium_andersonii.AAC.2